MVLQEPVQAAIWDSLNNYAYPDAIFLAERLNAEVSNSETLHLLATCYYRSGKPFQAYKLLERSAYTTAQCKYLMARCCTDINKYAEAESLITGTILTKVKSFEEIESEFGSMACYVFSLLGFVYSKTERAAKSSQCYRRSLKLNPLLWKSFEMLCSMGESVKADSIFQIPTQSTVSVTPSTDTTTTTTAMADQRSDSNISSSVTSTDNLLSPRNIWPNQTPDPNSQNHPWLQDTNKPPLPTKPKADAPQVRKSTVATSLFSNTMPSSPSFGLLPVESPVQSLLGSSTPSFISPHPCQAQTLKAQAPMKARAMTRRAQVGKSPVLNWSNTLKKMKDQEPVNAPIRRSSRLFGNSNSNSSSVKENNKSQTPCAYTGNKSAGRRTKSRMTKSHQELNENNKETSPSPLLPGELSVDTKCSITPEIPVVDQIVQMHQQSLTGILSLLRILGRAYSALSRYECKTAIFTLTQLPEHQYATGWVLSQMGKAYYELTEYQQAAKVFEELRRIEPYHIEGLDCYSSILWHLHREVELSSLAQDLTAMDKSSAQAWFATGNCFSLQKEHDVAIKFFQRAIQVEPNFVYAYSLLALEYIYLEEFDKALTCFRNAIRLDRRHYQAWYGVGMIYYKQEKFNLAEAHYRKALSINPSSSILMCHIGVAQHAQQKTSLALDTLTTAIKADPKNALCMFHRASILFAIDRHKEALTELEALKEIIPRESLVYFLMGKVHKKLGNTDLAMMNFSWAMDLDPKGLNNQIKEAVDKRYVAEEDDPLARLEQESEAEVMSFMEPGGDGEGGSTSQDESTNEGGGVNLMPDLQAVESDESL